MLGHKRIQLIGNLVAKPEVKYINNEEKTPICEVSIAVNGFKEDEVDFFPLVLSNEDAENCSKYLDKGSLVFVEGTPYYDKWEKDGQKHSVMKTRVNRILFMPTSKKAE
jgi:single-strand DNA-binding protein